MDYLLVLVTVPARLDAEQLVRELLTRRCIAGANILPGAVTLYRGSDGIAPTRETLLLCRTLPEHIEQLRVALRAQVGDDDFEISPLPIQSGNTAYTAWVQRALAVYNKNESDDAGE